LIKKDAQEIAERYADQIMPPFDEIMRVGNFEALFAFLTLYGGNYVHIPKLKTVLRSCIIKDLETRQDIDIKAYAKKYGFSCRWVRKKLQEISER